MDEKQLIRECLKNNEEAQRELFMRFSGKMLAVCRRYARHEMEAEDMLQDTFVRVFSNLHSFKSEGSFEGWIRRITINTAIKHCQRKAFSNEASGLEHLQDFAKTGIKGSLFDEEVLLALIKALPEGYRLVFNLYAIEGYSHNDIANMLGITDSTSRSQLAKARKMLQRNLTLLDKEYHQQKKATTGTHEGFE